MARTISEYSSTEAAHFDAMATMHVSSSEIPAPAQRPVSSEELENLETAYLLSRQSEMAAPVRFKPHQFTRIIRAAVEISVAPEATVADSNAWFFALWCQQPEN